MPQRKRTQFRESDDGAPKKLPRSENKEEPLTISDSEDEEEECIVKPLSRSARQRGRENKAQVQEMTEEEMLDLAMRLSEQEANSAAQRKKQEEAAMRKAIEESLHGNSSQGSEAESESTAPSQSPNYQQQQDPETATSRLRRKLAYPSQIRVHGDGALGDVAEAAVRGVGRRRDCSPLPQMPNMSQSQKTCSQSSPVSSVTPSVPFPSSEQECSPCQKKDLEEPPTNGDPQECGSLKSDSQLRKSPVFPRQQSSLCRPSIRVEKLSQDLVEDCKASGFVLCSRDSSLSLTSPCKTQSTHQGSPAHPQSPVFTKTDPRGDENLPKDEGRLSTAGGDRTVETRKLEDGDPPQERQSRKSLSLKSRDHPQCLSLTRKVLPSNQRFVPDDKDGDINVSQENVEQKETKNEPSQGGLDKMDKSAMSVPAEEDHSDERTLPVESRPLHEYSSHMVLHWTDDEDDDDDEDGPGKVGSSPSPVFPQEPAKPGSPSPIPAPLDHTHRTPPTTIHTLNDPSHEGKNKLKLIRRKFTFKNNHVVYTDQPETSGSDRVGGRGQDTSASNARLPPLAEEPGEGAVVYYWGVPFCPQGQNPDDYTRVILSQLEVYEKSLKAAQRGLLRKAEWGQPVLPGPPERPFSRKRLKRHRAPLLLEEDEEEDKAEEVVVEDEEEGEKERAESGGGSQESGGNEQGRNYVVLSSPEPEKSPLLYVQEESTEVMEPYREHGLQESPDDTQIQQPNRPEERKKQEKKKEEEDEDDICPETQLSEDGTPELMVTSPAQSMPRPESEVMEVEEEGSAPAGVEERMEEEVLLEAPAPQGQRVECPMCMRLFPLAKIEMHAAYCDGTGDDQDTQQESHSPVVQRKRTRRAELMEEDQPRSSGSDNRAAQSEKCFLCQRMFPLKEYDQHVEVCIKHRSTRSSQGATSLLSALDQTEQTYLGDDEAGPSDTAVRNKRGLVSDMDAAGGGGDYPAFGLRVSNSPIKSFTPISEATDSLVDFKNQYSTTKPSHRGRKRKFKR